MVELGADNHEQSTRKVDGRIAKEVWSGTPLAPYISRNHLIPSYAPPLSMFKDFTCCGHFTQILFNPLYSKTIKA